MEKTLVLLAGYPATGKTDLAERIASRHPAGFTNVSYDDIKEEFWDRYGFNNAEEKDQINARALDEYFNRVDAAMAAGVQIMSDYPFSNKQKGTLQKLSEKNGYRVLTIRLVGDPKIIIARSQRRDLSPSRHLGHIVSCYHKGDVLEDRSKGDQLVDLDLLIKRCEEKGYGTFELGHTIEVDATDVGSIDYASLLDEIDEFLDDENSTIELAKRAGASLSDQELVANMELSLLKPTLTWDQVQPACLEALRAGYASVCVPPSFVERVHDGFPNLTISTVVGFPLGYSTSASKAVAATEAVAAGASEVEMVIDQGMVMTRDYDAIEADVRAVRNAVPDAVLKVTVETCYLAQETKEPLCDLIARSGADLIKTSTGFGTAGAQVEDVALFVRALDGRIGVEAAGSICSREAVATFAGAGADRIASSASPTALFCSEGCE